MGLFDKKEGGRLGIFSIFDIKAQIYGNPFFQINNGSALRSFEDLANDSQSTVNRHPEDYNLFRIGSFDDLSGQLFPEVPQSLGLAKSYVLEVVKN